MQNYYGSFFSEIVGHASKVRARSRLLLFVNNILIKDDERKKEVGAV